MRLLTQNLMACIHCETFPLTVECSSLAPAEHTFDAAWTRRILARVDYGYLKKAVEDIRKTQAPLLTNVQLPETVEEVVNGPDDAPGLKAVAHALAGIAVQSGALVCPHCSTSFPIADFIPNMMAEQK